MKRFCERAGFDERGGGDDANCAAGHVFLMLSLFFLFDRIFTRKGIMKRFPSSCRLTVKGTLCTIYMYMAKAFNIRDNTFM